MKKIILGTLAALALATGASAQTVSIGAGVATPAESSSRRIDDVAFQVDVVSAPVLPYGIQVGGQLNTLNNNSNPGRVGRLGGINTTTASVFAQKEFANETAFTPYVKAGVGYSWLNGAGALDNTGTTYLAGAGVSYAVTDTLSVAAEYERIGAFEADVRKNNGRFGDYKNNAFVVKLSKQF